MKTVLMVAEKPSLAQSIAKILSRGRRKQTLGCLIAFICKHSLLCFFGHLFFQSVPAELVGSSGIGRFQEAP